MTEFKITAKTREEKINKVRRAGLIPAVVYGKNFEGAKISMDKLAFSHVFREAGSSNLIDLVIGDDKSFKTLIHDLQRDPLTNEVLHVDFLKVNMKEKIHADIPLKFIGDSPAVIDLEGSLITPLDHVAVECLPGDLIPEIEIDISALDNFEKTIKVADLKVPAGIEILTEPEETIVFVQEPRSEEELAELEEAVEENVEAVEVEHKGEEAPAEGETTEPAPAEEKKEVE